MNSPFQRGLLIAVSIAALSACGGGGGSSSTPVTPPPTGGGGGANAAPVVSISAAEVSVAEGQSTSLDGSFSSDADGDDLTFTWTQLSGPTLAFSAANEAETTISVPNLSGDTTARIQLQVSDGTVTSTDEVTLNLINLVISPTVNSNLIEAETISFQAPIIAIPTSFGFDSLNYLAYENGGQTAIDLVGFDSGNNLSILEAELTATDATRFTAQGTPSRFGPNFIAGFSDTEVTFFEPLGTPFENLSHDVDSPCSLVGNENFIFGNTFIGSQSGDNVLIEFTGPDFSEPTGTSELLSFGADMALC